MLLFLNSLRSINNCVAVAESIILASMNYHHLVEDCVHICLGVIVKGENRIERLSKIKVGEVAERGSRE